MDIEQNHATSHRLWALAEKFHDKQYRDGYVASHTRRVLAEQMRNFRGDLTQADYAAKIGKQKTVIGRLENPAYSGWSLRTMHEVARKENVAVIARFVDFPTFLSFTDDLSSEALRPNESKYAVQLGAYGVEAMPSFTPPVTPRALKHAHDEIQRLDAVIKARDREIQELRAEIAGKS